MIEPGRVYHIINAETGKALDVYNPDGSTVLGWGFNRSQNQQWIIERVGEGLCTLKCVKNGVYLGYRQPLQPDSTAIGVEMAIKWALVQEEKDTYRIFIPKVWLQLSLKHPSVTPAQLSYPQPGRNQTWKIRPV